MAGTAAPLTEAQIRALVVAELTARHREDDAAVLLVEELGVGRGASRADVAVIAADALTGVEVKSAADTLTRLPAQVTWYSRVFDRAVLACDPGHVTAAAAHLPSWWGLWAADVDGLRVVRAAAANPVVDGRTLAAMLWMPELKALMPAIGQTGGTAGLLRGDLADLLATVAPDRVGELVRRALLDRDWEDVGAADGSVRTVRQPTPTRTAARRARRDNRRARAGRRR